MFVSDREFHLELEDGGQVQAVVGLEKFSRPKNFTGDIGKTDAVVPIEEAGEGKPIPNGGKRGKGGLREDFFLPGSKFRIPKLVGAQLFKELKDFRVLALH